MRAQGRAPEMCLGLSLPASDHTVQSSILRFGAMRTISHLLFFFRMERYSGQLRGGSLGTLALSNLIWLRAGLEVR